MSGRNRKKAKKKNGRPWYESAWLSGLLLLAVAAYLGLSLSGGAGPWWRLVTGGETGDLVSSDNPGGPAGSLMSLGLHVVFGGLWCWLFPVVLILLGIGFLRPGGRLPWSWVLRAIPLWLVTTAFIAQPGNPIKEEAGVRLGGIVGFYLARGFHGLFGLWGGRIFLGLFVLIAFILVFKPWLGWTRVVLRGVGRGLAVVGQGLLEVVRWPWRLLSGLAETAADRTAVLKEKAAAKREEAAQRRVEEEAAQALAQEDSHESDEADDADDTAKRERRVHSGPDANEDSKESIPVPETAPPVDSFELPGASGEYIGDEVLPETIDGGVKPTLKKAKPRKKSGPVILPGLELLTPAGPEGQPISTVELDQSADLLEDTLRSFGVEGEVKDVRPGPVVTTFEYQPGHGIRVNQIVQRTDDLALAMRARSIRMEAPIPGKAAVGIEIPNPTAKMVRLREVLELTGDSERPPLSVVLGKDVVGRPTFIDIASLPHLLVAGSTGSGKSVCLNAIISNLLLRNDPSTLRMVLIDPKMLEMNVYNGIPHLLLPVVTDPREALKALQWMVAQMEYRYRQLSQHSVRNIQQYNDKVVAGQIVDKAGDKVTEPMPFYLTIVDELADLMLQLGKDLEDLITRLAQKARAVGIHLILATQRPSVDVLTGVIKANIPCRIAFRVIQKNDSRTVLDMNGAEQLLGHGDMLYLQPGRALPVRVHGSFIDVDECEAIAAHWRQYKDVTEEISLNQSPSGGGMVTGQDDLFDDAMRVVVLHQSGSTSLLQRRLRIGYTRAGRLMDMLEEAGIVGPFTGSKARDVMIKPEELPEADEGEA